MMRLLVLLIVASTATIVLAKDLQGSSSPRQYTMLHATRKQKIAWVKSHRHHTIKSNSKKPLKVATRKRVSAANIQRHHDKSAVIVKGSHGWIISGHKEFRMVKGLFTREQAEEQCRRLGARLATVRKGLHMRAVQQLIIGHVSMSSTTTVTHYAANGQTWVSSVKSSNMSATWKWDDGTVSASNDPSLNWLSSHGEPKLSRGDCVSIVSGSDPSRRLKLSKSNVGKHMTQPCNKRMNALCYRSVKYSAIKKWYNADLYELTGCRKFNLQPKFEAVHDHLTISFCSKWCRKHRQQYMLLRNGNSCGCLETLTGHSSLSLTKCFQHTCPGNRNEYCGPSKSNEYLVLRIRSPQEIHLHNSSNCKPIAGKWNNWGSWQTCRGTNLLSCGVGVTQRYRTCDNPPPACGGAPCNGPMVSQKACSQLSACPRAGGWASWSCWTRCQCSNPQAHDYRTFTRRRKCDNPKPAHQGLPCEGLYTETQHCSCAVDGRWSSWMSWSVCSEPCGGGNHNRTRRCDSPKPSGGGHHCPLGGHTEVQRCNTQSCPSHGSWCPWKVWSHCSASCNDGIRTRKRRCACPLPLRGGHHCPKGPSEESKPCNLAFCVNPKQWGDWSPCYQPEHQDCGRFIKKRFRSCTGIKLGKKVVVCKLKEQEAECKRVTCDRDGGWNTWFNHLPCMSVHGKDCGKMRREQKRNCNRPRPRGHGKPCPGPSKRYLSCQSSPCPINGKWSKWTSWTACSSGFPGTGGCDFPTGRRIRLRHCNHPSPSHGGRFCSGRHHEIRSCTLKCIRDGQWGQWGSWGDCDGWLQRCGKGMRVRTRRCDNPGMGEDGGRPCKGDSREEKACLSRPKCPVDGGWSKWMSWGTCDVQHCQPDGSYVGERVRIRHCTHPHPENGGKSCALNPDIERYDRQRQACVRPRNDPISLHSCSIKVVRVTHKWSINITSIVSECSWTSD